MINKFYFKYSTKDKEVKIENNISLDRDLLFLRNDDFMFHRDIYNIACSVFTFERIIKKNRMIEELVIPVSEETYKKINIEKIQEIIELLIEEILQSIIKVKIVSEKIKFSKTKKKIVFEKADAICLFSGGVDSFSGLLNTRKHFKKVIPLFIAHSDQQGMISIVKKINKELFENEGILIKTIHAPSIKKGGYSQLRGFLYFVLAGIYANLSSSESIVITECGPTMYQPRFSPMDEITYTTHPKVLKATKNFLKELFGDMKIITPFEDLTKAEVIAASPNKLMFEKTHSCISQRSRSHDGTCYGCVIRRLGAIVVGIKDAQYNYDVLSQDDNPKKSDNFVNLINTSYDILFNYDELNDFTTEDIDFYSKQDLFKRFAMDNFAALFIYYEINKRKKSEFVSDLFNEAIKKIGKVNIEKRINEVRSNLNKPDFNKEIK